MKIANQKNSNSNIKSDYLLDLFYKLLISKDINRDVRSDNAFGRNVPFELSEFKALGDGFARIWILY